MSSDVIGGLAFTHSKLREPQTSMDSPFNTEKLKVANPQDSCLTSLASLSSKEASPLGSMKSRIFHRPSSDDFIESLSLVDRKETICVYEKSIRKWRALCKATPMYWTREPRSCSSIRKEAHLKRNSKLPNL